MTRRLGPPGLIVGTGVLLCLMLLALLADLLAPHPPRAIVAAPLLPPSGEHLLGTDEVGRDILSRVLYGGRAELFISLTASLIATALGAIIGLLVGLRGSLADIAAMRFADIIFAFPSIVLALFLIAVFGRGVGVQIMAIAIVLTPGTLRLARGLGLQLRPRFYIEASRLAGAGPWHVFWRHALPNAMPTLLVLASIMATVAITIAAGLAFLGLGVAPPTPTWGGMLRSSYVAVYQAPSYGIFPGLLITLAALSYTLIGNGLREQLGATGVAEKTVGGAA